MFRCYSLDLINMIKRLFWVGKGLKMMLGRKILQISFLFVGGATMYCDSIDISHHPEGMSTLLIFI